MWGMPAPSARKIKMYLGPEGKLDPFWPAAGCLVNHRPPRSRPPLPRSRCRDFDVAFSCLTSKKFTIKRIVSGFRPRTIARYSKRETGATQTLNEAVVRAADK